MQAVFNEEEFDEWLSGDKDVLSRKSEFESMGLGNHNVFQTLVFMGHATYQMTLAKTVADKVEAIPSEIMIELDELMKRYSELQCAVREYTFSKDADSQ